MFSLFRRAFVRHWRLAGLVAATIYLLALLVTAAIPPVYCSTAQLSVIAGRESEMSSLIEVCRSEATLEQLVSSLGPEYSRIGRGKPNLLSVRQLQNWVEIAQRGNTLSVQCRAKLPAHAQQLATRMAEICIDESRRLPTDSASNNAVSDQTAQSKADWAAAAARLADARKRTGNETIDSQRKAIEQKIADSEAKIRAVQGDLIAAEDRIAALAKQIAAAPEPEIAKETEAVQENKTAPERNALSETESQDTTGADLQGKLESLEARERELASIRSDDHPQLVALRQQLAELRAALAAPLQPKVPEPPADRVSRADLQLQLERDLNEVAAFCEREEVLAAQSAGLRDELEKLRSVQSKALAQLEREVSTAEQRYRTQLAQSGRNDLAANSEVPLLSIVQGATLPTRPDYPQSASMLTWGLLGGALCGLGTALVAALFRRVLRHCEELERVLDLPVVGVLPRSALAPAATS